ncbi:hypothetical protein ES703_116110 [subsurface metagenome]
MSEKPELPIHKLSLEEFAEFKKKHLDIGGLTSIAIDRIRDLFGVDCSKHPSLKINCDEAHEHHYDCLYFYSPEAGIVARLCDEIDEYKRILKRD